MVLGVCVCLIFKVINSKLKKCILFLNPSQANLFIVTVTYNLVLKTNKFHETELCAMFADSL